MKEKRAYTPFLWKMDCFFALHQRLCWLMAAGAAVLGGLLILCLVPEEYSVYAVLALALLDAGGYHFLAQSSRRVMKECLCRAESREAAAEMLPLYERAERAMPAMKQREMAYMLTIEKGLLMLRAGRREESLSLLRGFSKCWDERQKEYLRQLIEQIEARPDFCGFAGKEEC